MIAHALIGRPKLLLLDEPLANLDIRSGQEVVELLDGIATEQGVAVLLSAHDMNPLLPVMDHLVYLADGRAASGTTEEVVRTEILSRLYGHQVEVVRAAGRVLVVSGFEDGHHHRHDRDPRSGRAERSGHVAAVRSRGSSRADRSRWRWSSGGVVAVISAMVGTFTVIRGQSFAGHALSDIGTAGGSGAILVGVPTLYGFVAMNLAAAGVMELIGIRRPRGRDVATGIVLGASLGLAALFLYLDTVHTSTTGATVNVLFGSIFTVSTGTVPLVVVLGLTSVALIALVYRPLLLSSVSDELARAKGVSTRRVGIAFLAALAIAVSLSAITIGAILSTALLIGPAAAALRLTKRTGPAIGVAAATRGGGDLARHPPRLRQRQLVLHRAGLAGQLLHRPDRVRRVPGRIGGVATDRAAGPGVAGRGPADVRPFMITAWEASAVVAVVAGVVGFFTVLRGSAFAAHPSRTVPSRAPPGRACIGANELVGLGVFAVAGAVMIATLGRRARNDVATALTIVVMLGLGDLFLSRTTEYAQEIYALLFGEVLGVSSAELLPTIGIAVVCMAAVAVLYRPLLLTSIAPEVAEARGIRRGRMDLYFLLVLALATTAAVPVVGSLLIFSLLIGPPAAAGAMTKRPLVAMGLAVVIALATVWSAIALSYQLNLPVGFFVGTISALVYAVGRAWGAWRPSTRSTPAPGSAPALADARH